MNRFSKLFFLIALFVLFLLSFSGSAVAAASGKILLVSGNSHSQYSAAGKEIKRGWKASGYAEESLDEVSSDSYNPAELENFDVLVAIGMPAVRKVLAERIDIPLLAVMVPRLPYEKSLQQYQKKFGKLKKGKASAIYMDQPVSRLVNLARLISDNTEKLGVLLSEEAISFRQEVKSIEHDNVKVVVATPRDKRAVVDSFNRKLRGVDALLIAYDPEVIDVTSTKQLLYLSYRRRLPVVAYSSSIVRAGAVSGVFSSGEQAGQHAIEWIQNLKWSRKIKFPEADYSRYFSVECNASVARYLDLLSACSPGLAEKLEALE